MSFFIFSLLFWFFLIVNHKILSLWRCPAARRILLHIQYSYLWGVRRTKNYIRNRIYVWKQKKGFYYLFRSVFVTLRIFTHGFLKRFTRTGFFARSLLFIETKINNKNRKIKIREQKYEFLFLQNKNEKNSFPWFPTTERRYDCSPTTTNDAGQRQKRVQTFFFTWKF